MTEEKADYLGILVFFLRLPFLSCYQQSNGKQELGNDKCRLVTTKSLQWKCIPDTSQVALALQVYMQLPGQCCGVHCVVCVLEQLPFLFSSQIVKMAHCFEVLLHSSLILEAQIAIVHRNIFFHLQLARRLYLILTAIDLAMVIHVFMTTRDDHCDALLLGKKHANPEIYSNADKIQ